MQKELHNFLKGKSIAGAAKKLRVSRQTIYNWIKGKHGFTHKNWLKIVHKK